MGGRPGILLDHVIAGHPGVASLVARTHLGHHLLWNGWPHILDTPLDTVIP